MKRILVCLFVLLATTAAFAETRYTVYWLDKEYEPHVNLKGLQPLSEGMRAVLAFYAMRASSGCEYGDDHKLYCKLTSSLDLGEQASKKEIDLVRKWFRKKIPAIDLDQAEADRIMRTGDFESLRYTVPDTATHQTMWDIIRLEQDGDKVTVYVMGSWTTGPMGKAGHFRYETVYRIGTDAIEILSERELK